MDLSDITNSAGAQEKGHEFELLDPVRGDPTGIKLRLAGPDSQISRKARQTLEREVSRLSNRSGGMSPEARERLMDDFFAAITLDWTVKEKGKSVPYSKDAFLRLLRAGLWVRAQIDGFAGDRSPYFKTDA